LVPAFHEYRYVLVVLIITDYLPVDNGPNYAYNDSVEFQRFGLSVAS
jgi:hypothetical protein